MKYIRPIYIVECCICGKEIDKLTAHEIFTGRTKYVCRECHNNGNRQIDARKSEWRSSARGKLIVSESEKNK